MQGTLGGVEGLIDLFQDPRFLASGAVGAVVAVLAWLDAGRRDGVSRVGAGWLATVGIGVALAIASIGDANRLARYAELPPDDHVVIGMLIAAIAPLVLSSLLRVAPDGHARERMLSATFGAAVLGLFLCIPDTETLRLIIAPISAVALLVALGHVRPFSRPWLLAAGLVLSWVCYRDGLERLSAMVGLVAVVASFCLVLLVPRRALADQLFKSARPAFIPLAAVVLSSRLAGVRPSMVLATTLALVVVGGAIVLLRSEVAKA